jgi:COMPASS component SPP1
MAFKISAILNPAPRSRRATPTQDPKPSTPEDNGSDNAASPSVHAGTGAAQKSTRRNSVQTDRASLSQPTPIEPPYTNTAITAGPSSPTLEQYRLASNSPEQSHRVLESHSHSPPAPSNQPTRSAPGVSLPLFRPAQPKDSHGSSKSPDPRESSPLVKKEEGATPDEMPPPAAALEEIEDLETRAAVQAVLNEYGLRGTRKQSEASPAADTTPAPRKLPIKKGAVATKKASTKKSAPKRKPSSAKTAAKATKVVGKNESSTTPAPSSSPGPADPDDEEMEDVDDEGSEDEALYCICLKPDDHKYMIACDGGCDNWFHGKCVHITEEDGKLIDKYICPNCEEKGIGVTTWKPMCRRQSCRKAARLANGITSKYCSDECGVLFMQEHLTLSMKEAQINATKPKSNKRKLDDSNSPQRGGPLAPGVLKSLIKNISTAKQFRALGDSILSTVPAEIQAYLADPASAPPSVLTSSERSELLRMTAKKDDLRERRALLKERERFIAMVKEQHTTYAEREGLKVKDICGFDARLSWSAGAFAKWRQSASGIAAFESGSLTLPASAKQTNGVADGDVEMHDVDTAEEEPMTICTKKRCERHRNWAKLMLEDGRFEEASLADQMREAERVERQLKETALLRWREEQAQGNGQSDGINVAATIVAV